MERRQGPLSCLLFGDDNNAPLFHLYKLRNCSVIRNNHRLKAMEDVLISDLKWRVINFTAQSSNYSFPIFCLGNLHESRHAPNLGKICSGKYKVCFILERPPITAPFLSSLCCIFFCDQQE